MVETLGAVGGDYRDSSRVRSYVIVYDKLGISTLIESLGIVCVRGIGSFGGFSYGIGEGSPLGESIGSEYVAEGGSYGDILSG